MLWEASCRPKAMKWRAARLDTAWQARVERSGLNAFPIDVSHGLIMWDWINDNGGLIRWPTSISICLSIHVYAFFLTDIWLLLGIRHSARVRYQSQTRLALFFLTTSFINLLSLNNGSYVLIPAVMPDSTWGEWLDLNLYTGSPLFRASSQNLDSHGALGKRSYVANLLFSSYLRALLESRS